MKKQIFVACSVITLLLVGIVWVGLDQAIKLDARTSPPSMPANALTLEEVEDGQTVNDETPVDFEKSKAIQEIENLELQPPTIEHCIAMALTKKMVDDKETVQDADCYTTEALALDALRVGAYGVEYVVVSYAKGYQLSAPLIGKDYDNPNYGGSVLYWYGPGGATCYTTTLYAPNMPWPWNDDVSSARGYSGCNNYKHYELTFYGGSLKICTCSTMGVMAETTSSEIFSQ